MIIIGIDPGNVQSAYVEFNANKNCVISSGILPNIEFMNLMETKAAFPTFQPVHFVIEQIASYGMAVGETVFETVYWSGIFTASIWQYGGKVDRIKRMAVKMNLCHSARAKDGNIRQALIDRFGEVGTKKNPGPLFGMAADKWAALAVAVTWIDTMKDKK